MAPAAFARHIKMLLRVTKTLNLLTVIGLFFSGVYMYGNAFGSLTGKMIHLALAWPMIYGFLALFYILLLKGFKDLDRKRWRFYISWSLLILIMSVSGLTLLSSERWPFKQFAEWWTLGEIRVAHYLASWILMSTFMIFIYMLISERLRSDIPDDQESVNPETGEALLIQEQRRYTF